MILLGCPGVIPEWPLDQSYDMAYAKMLPLRLNAVAAMGPGDGSKAVVEHKADIYMVGRRVITFQPGPRILVPKVDGTIRTFGRVSKAGRSRTGVSYRRWRTCHELGGTKCHLLRRPQIDLW